MQSVLGPLEIKLPLRSSGCHLLRWGDLGPRECRGKTRSEGAHLDFLKSEKWLCSVSTGGPAMLSLVLSQAKRNRGKNLRRVKKG
jgi:hypothetical protein